MENGPIEWRFQGNFKRNAPAKPSIAVALDRLRQSLDKDDQRTVISLGLGDPSIFASYRIDSAAEDAIADAVRSTKFNSYSPPLGIPEARRSLYFTFSALFCFLAWIEL